MMDQQAQPGLKRAPAPILVLSADGAVIDTLAAPPGQEQAYIRSGEHMGALPAAFGRILSLAVRGRQLYVATGAFQGFDLYDPDRGWLQSTRLAGTEDLTIRPDDLAAFNNAMLAEMPSSSARAEFSVLLNTVEVPRTKAPVSRIVVDDAGSVWLSEYESPYFGASGWHIIDGEGRYRGRVATPVSLRIQDVRHSKVVGVWRGEDGVQSVRVYPLSVNP
jgi:hypothetical protein